MGGPQRSGTDRGPQVAQEDERRQHQGQDSQAIIILQIARIIANFSLFLDLTDDEILDPDAAVEMMEELASGLQQLDKGFLRELVDAFAEITPEYSGESQRLVRNMARDFYLEEALAADDPVRLAELEALRDADD